MTNPRLRKIAKKNAKILKFKYGNFPIINQLIEYYNSEGNTTISDIDLILQNNNIVGERREQVLDNYQQVENMSDLGLTKVVEKFKRLISTIVLESASKESDPSKAIDRIMASEIDVIDDKKIASKVTRYDFKNLNVKKMLEDFGQPIKSSIDAINSCSVIKGYIPRQLISVVAPPSTGKSLFLMNEMVKFLKDGYKCCYIALGDLTQYDFVTRLPAINNGITINQALMDPEAAWNDFCKDLGDKWKNFTVEYIDSNTMSSDELMEYIKDQELDKQYDIFFIDYDSNFLSTNDLYTKGDEIYNNLVNLAKRVKLVFVASQPKTAAYNNEIIYMNEAAESSRKSQIVDLMITISKNPISKTQIGYINLAKVRRGMTSTAFNYMLNQSGRFIPITIQHYKGLEKDEKKRDIPNKPVVANDDISDLNSLIS